MEPIRNRLESLVLARPVVGLGALVMPCALISVAAELGFVAQLVTVFVLIGGVVVPVLHPFRVLLRRGPVAMRASSRRLCRFHPLGIIRDTVGTIHEAVACWHSGDREGADTLFAGFERPGQPAHRRALGLWAQLELLTGSGLWEEAAARTLPVDLDPGNIARIRSAILVARARSHCGRHEEAETLLAGAREGWVRGGWNWFPVGVVGPDGTKLERVCRAGTER